MGKSDQRLRELVKQWEKTVIRKTEEIKARNETINDLRARTEELEAQVKRKDLELFVHCDKIERLKSELAEAKRTISRINQELAPASEYRNG